tara:strand:+ start:138 stop:344 length:207 start_codon:yes stop_codon:yes gene_type:complete
MSQIVPIGLLICVSIIGITMTIWFNCSIHQLIQRRIEISSRTLPVVQARQISGELPVDIVIIEVNSNV